MNAVLTQCVNQLRQQTPRAGITRALCAFSLQARVDTELAAYDVRKEAVRDLLEQTLRREYWPWNSSRA